MTTRTLTSEINELVDNLAELIMYSEWTPETVEDMLNDRNILLIDALYKDFDADSQAYIDYCYRQLAPLVGEYLQLEIDLANVARVHGLNPLVDKVDKFIQDEVKRAALRIVGTQEYQEYKVRFYSRED